MEANVHKALRLAVLVGVASAGILAVLFLQPDARARGAQYDICAKSLSSDCLADLALEVGLAGQPPSPHSNGMDFLRVTGRDAAARALIVRAEELDGKTPEEALRAADAKLAAPRLARAVRQGMSPDEVFAAVPEVRYGNVYIAALDLLGKKPYGVGLGTTNPIEVNRAAAAGFAELLVRLAEDLDGLQKESALEDAAELFALLGDRDRAAQIFLGIPRDSDWSGIVSPQLMDPTIGAAALKLCGSRAECRVRVLHRPAMVAETENEADAVLREAFDLHRNRTPWPDFDEMAKVVGLAVDRADMALALDLARALDGLSQSREDVFPSFPHIFAARALLVAAAPVADVRAALDRAEAEMPGGGDAVIGFGHMGPITWGGGIGSQARWEQAALRAQIGEGEHAIRLLEGIEDPAYAWGQVLGPDLSPEIIGELMPVATDALGAREGLLLRAQTAAEMFWWETSRAHRDWALQTAREVMAAVDPGDEGAVAICRAVARVARGSGDRALRQAALTCAGEAAILSRDATELLEAAALWFAHEASAP